ncbi:MULTISPECIES: hypothetical protein [unclassified Snodgrassella]|uniref:hypothetical protein n=1 Tax=unclassified Snodgrassella TaxID=2625236 RepID=UPI0018DEA62A|nr:MULTISPECIES: hypothetical protein [unclassified Snodgrassella]MBI0068099.1 hypothetical protein [Snodgrassella sp. M0110]MBI0077260.1 hypothetical protein [Snodgrassella sp. M0118]MBI0079399.1 hypothetical protein [Snodgrassella sp. M0112]
MIKECTNSREWISLEEACIELMNIQYRFKETNDIKDLLNQLLLTIHNNDLAEQATVLRLIRDNGFTALELEILTPVIINIAVNRNTDNSILARQCLVNRAFNHDHIIREKLTSMFDDFLQSEDQYTYRRLAELLFFLDYKDLRKRLMEKCKNSKDKNIVNIYTEFTEKYDF